MKFRISSSRGMVLPVCLIFLAVIFTLSLSALQGDLLTQKISSADLAQAISFSTAEAGIVAEETKINGGAVDLSNLKGSLNFGITKDTVDNCQRHIYTIQSSAVYQNAHTNLLAGYLFSPLNPPPECTSQPSRQLWWRQSDSSI